MPTLTNPIKFGEQYVLKTDFGSGSNVGVHYTSGSSLLSVNPTTGLATPTQNPASKTTVSVLAASTVAPFNSHPVQVDVIPLTTNRELNTVIGTGDNSNNTGTLTAEAATFSETGSPGTGSDVLLRIV